MREGTALKLKDKKIEIFVPVSSVNENGYAVTTLQAICPPVWAYFRHLSGKEVSQRRRSITRKKSCSKSTTERTYRPAHVIRYNGVLYDITRIDNFEGRKEDLKLYCARRARQNL